MISNWPVKVSVDSVLLTSVGILKKRFGMHRYRQIRAYCQFVANSSTPARKLVEHLDHV